MIANVKSVGWRKEWFTVLMPIAFTIAGFCLMKGYEIDRNVYLLQQQQIETSHSVDELKEQFTDFTQEERKYNDERQKSFDDFVVTMNQQFAGLKIKAK